MHQYLLIYHVNIVSSIIQCIGIRTEDKQNDDKTKLMSNNFENTILNRWSNFFFSDQRQIEMQIACKIDIIDLSIRSESNFLLFLFQYFYAQN